MKEHDDNYVPLLERVKRVEDFAALTYLGLANETEKVNILWKLIYQAADLFAEEKTVELYSWLMCAIEEKYFKKYITERGGGWRFHVPVVKTEDFEKTWAMCLSEKSAISCDILHDLPKGKIRLVPVREGHGESSGRSEPHQEAALVKLKAEVMRQILFAECEIKDDSFARDLFMKVAKFYFGFAEEVKARKEVLREILSTASVNVARYTGYAIELIGSCDRSSYDLLDNMKKELGFLILNHRTRIIGMNLAVQEARIVEPVRGLSTHSIEFMVKTAERVANFDKRAASFSEFIKDSLKKVAKVVFEYDSLDSLVIKAMLCEYLANIPHQDVLDENAVKFRELAAEIYGHELKRISLLQCLPSIRGEFLPEKETVVTS